MCLLGGINVGIRLLIADHLVLVRNAVGTLLESLEPSFSVVGLADNGGQVEELIRSAVPDICLLEYELPLVNAVALIPRILRNFPATRCVILSSQADYRSVQAALESGANGYLLKTDHPQLVVQALQEISKGHIFLSPGVAMYALERRDGSPGQNRSSAFHQLTGREYEVLQLLAEGFSNKEMAYRLTLSIHTVLTHRKNLMRKLGLRRQADLVKYALRERITSLS
jgi:two-component system response regulator NreC